MKKLLDKKAIKIVSTLLFFILTFVVLHFTPLNALHGRSDATIIIGIVGSVALIVSYLFNLNRMTVSATFGYGLSVVIGVLFESEGMIFDNNPIHTMWIVWLVSYCVMILVGLLCDFLWRVRTKKSRFNRVGACVSVLSIVIIIFSYTTKPLTVNDVFAHKPQFYGVVVEIYENSMLLGVDEKSFVADSGDRITVSLDVAMSDLSVKQEDFVVGDIVRLYFSGEVAESYPLQAGTVYAISRIDAFICEEGIRKNGDLYDYDDIARLTGLPVSALKVYAADNPSQFIMDFLNQLRNPLAYDDTTDDVSKDTNKEQEIVGVPNPLVEVESARDFEETLGLTIDAPEGATHIAYGILADEIAQINYTFDERRFVLRVSKSVSEQALSGMYGDFEPTNLVAKYEAGTVTIDTIALEDGSAFATSKVERLDKEPIYVALSTTNQMASNNLTAMMNNIALVLLDR